LEVQGIIVGSYVAVNSRICSRNLKKIGRSFLKALPGVNLFSPTLILLGYRARGAADGPGTFPPPYFLFFFKGEIRGEKIKKV